MKTTLNENLKPKSPWRDYRIFMLEEYRYQYNLVLFLSCDHFHIVPLTLVILLRMSQVWKREWYMTIFAYVSYTIDIFVFEFDFVYLSFHLVIYLKCGITNGRYNKDFYEKPGITKICNHTFWKTSGITKNGITNVFEILAGITKNWKKIVKKV